MAALLPSPELQFIDGNGHPYVGGTLATYVPGTTTPKNTWQNAGATILNTNPIVLDSAGRCICYGDGQYRCILHDALGNLVFDQLSDTLVSAAMAPVIAAPTIAAAVALLGIQDMIDIETNRATAAENNLQSQITGGATTAALNAEIARAEAAEAALGTRIDNETAARIAGDEGLTPGAGAVTWRTGTATTDLAGVLHVAYSPPFATMTAAGGPAFDYDPLVYQIQSSGFVVSLSGATVPLVLASDGTTPAPASLIFNYMTFGY